MHYAIMITCYIILGNLYYVPSPQGMRLALHIVLFHLLYSKISIIRTMIIRISGLIQTLMNVPFLMYEIYVAG